MKLNIFGYVITINKESFEDKALPKDLKEALQILKKYGYKPNKVSSKKTNAAINATKIRQQRTQEKINKAIDTLKNNNKKITIYSIAKEANVSYNTVKKYRYYVANAQNYSHNFS